MSTETIPGMAAPVLPQKAGKPVVPPVPVKQDKEKTT